MIFQSLSMCTIFKMVTIFNYIIIKVSTIFSQLSIIIHVYHLRFNASEDNSTATKATIFPIDQGTRLPIRVPRRRPSLDLRPGPWNDGRFRWETSVKDWFKAYGSSRSFLGSGTGVWFGGLSRLSTFSDTGHGSIGKGKTHGKIHHF